MAEGQMCEDETNENEWQWSNDNGLKKMTEN
jgi:hypothetical protein